MAIKKIEVSVLPYSEIEKLVPEDIKNEFDTLEKGYLVQCHIDLLEMDEASLYIKHNYGELLELEYFFIEKDF